MRSVSPSEDRSLEETAYLLGSQANARHLERSIGQLRAGDVAYYDLVETGDDAGS